VFIVVSIYFVIDSVRKLLDTPSYTHTHTHTHTYIRGLGCDVPGMILLRYLKRTMRLDRSKDMSVHVLTCIRASCVEVVTLMRRACLFLRLFAKMRDRQRADVCSDRSSHLTDNFFVQNYYWI
jgi:hypothetical protein